MSRSCTAWSLSLSLSLSCTAHQLSTATSPEIAFGREDQLLYKFSPNLFLLLKKMISECLAIFVCGLWKNSIYIYIYGLECLFIICLMVNVFWLMKGCCCLVVDTIPVTRISISVILIQYTQCIYTWLAPVLEAVLSKELICPLLRVGAHLNKGSFNGLPTAWWEHAEKKRGQGSNLI